MRSLLIVLLVSGLASCKNIPQAEEKEVDRGLLGDLLLGLISNMVTDQINNLLGITTTKATPILDIFGGILGGETTTSATTADPG